MAHFKPLLHTLRWLQIGIWTLYQVIFELWKLFTWISGQKSFWRSFDSVFFKYNTLTLTSKIALIGQFWSPTTPLKMKKFKKKFQIPWSYPKTFNFWENYHCRSKKVFFWKLKAQKHLIWNRVFTKINATPLKMVILTWDQCPSVDLNLANKLITRNHTSYYLKDHLSEFELRENKYK